MFLNRWKAQPERLSWLWVLAELLILIVGFFVGLQVNDWQEKRGERELEVEYLNRLLVDLEQSHSQLLTDVDRMTGAINKLDAGIVLLSEDVLTKAQHDVIFEAVSVGGLFGRFNVIFGTVEELKDTGNMRLIQSKELRAGLADLWQQYRQIIRLSDIRTLYRLEGSPQLSTHLSPEKGSLIGWDTDSVDQSKRELYSALLRIRINQAADIADSKELLLLLEENSAVIQSILE